MTFLDAKADIAFKKLFGDIAHKHVLISFLNNVLKRNAGNLIIDVTINDPLSLSYNVTNPTTKREVRLSKLNIIDIRCTDEKSNHCIIEMQVTTQKDFDMRAQFYSSTALSRQLEQKEQGSELIPVIFIGVVDCELFNNKEYINTYSMLNTKTYERDLKLFEYHFIELPKFHKKIDELKNVLDKWIYLLKHAEQLIEVPTAFEEAELKEALHVLNRSNWSKKELEAYDKDVRLETAEERGIEKGREAAKLEVAGALLDILDIEIIAQKTGLNIDAIQNLKAGKKESTFE